MRDGKDKQYCKTDYYYTIGCTITDSEGSSSSADSNGSHEENRIILKANVHKYCQAKRVSVS